MILHIPHSSRRLDGLVELQNEQDNLDFLTDDNTDSLFSYSPDPSIIFHYSRFVCDVERFRENDPMEKKEQGVIYRKDIFGNTIKRNISDEKVYKMYDNHHKQLIKSINFSLGLFFKVTIVDCHSFQSINEDDPDICLGTDYFHTPDELIYIVKKSFESNNLSVKLNYPYSGTLVPKIHYKKNKNIFSIMIEVNKGIYENNFHWTQNLINKCLGEISSYEDKFG